MIHTTGADVTADATQDRPVLVRAPVTFERFFALSQATFDVWDSLGIRCHLTEEVPERGVGRPAC